EGFRQGHQHAFRRRAGDGGDFRVTNALWAHEAHVQALFTGLAQQQAHLRVIAAVVDEVDAFTTGLGNRRGEVLVTGVDALEQANLDVLAFQYLLDRSGDAFAVLLLVVDDRDVAGLDVVGDEVPGGRALQAVQADGAEDQFVAARGDVRTGGRGGNHQDAFVLVDIGCRLGGAGAQMPNHEVDAVIDDLVGHRDRLL